MPSDHTTATRVRKLPERFGDLVPQSENEDDNAIVGVDEMTINEKKRVATDNTRDEQCEYSHGIESSRVPILRGNKRTPTRPKTDTNPDQTEVRATQGRRKKQKLPEDDASKATGGLHPPNANKSFYKQQAVSHRKEIKVLDQQIKERDTIIKGEQQIIQEMQVRLTSLEEALLDRSKTRTSVKLDTGRVRETFEELSRMCKEWAMAYKCSGTAKTNLGLTEGKVVYKALRGNQENLRR